MGSGGADNTPVGEGAVRVLIIHQWEMGREGTNYTSVGEGAPRDLIIDCEEKGGGGKEEAQWQPPMIHWDISKQTIEGERGVRGDHRTLRDLEEKLTGARNKRKPSVS